MTVEYEQHEVASLLVASDQTQDLAGGFMAVRRLHLTNRRADGTQSAPYVCDFVVRPKGIDAVVVVLWHRDRGGRVHVLLRQGLRPALAHGRRDANLPIADTREYLFFTEVVAGIIEHDDVGELGVRRRAAAESLEEAGYTVAPDAIEFLGAGTFPSPGSMPEKYWLVSAEVVDRTAQVSLSGDGSPMEEGATTRWAPLEETIQACVAGTIEDAKSELALRRLRDALG